jgi:hypothetical protein
MTTTDQPPDDPIFAALARCRNADRVVGHAPSDASHAASLAAHTALASITPTTLQGTASLANYGAGEVDAASDAPDGFLRDLFMNIQAALKQIIAAKS